MNSGRQRAGDSLELLKKYIFIFKTLQKMVRKLGQFKSWNVGKGSGFVNCLNFVTIFSKVLEMKMFFFNFPSYPPSFTRLQLLLAMARNLSIGTRRKKDSEGEKSAKKGLKTV